MLVRPVDVFFASLGGSATSAGAGMVSWAGATDAGEACATSAAATLAAGAALGAAGALAAGGGAEFGASCVCCVWLLQDKANRASTKV